MVSLVFLLATPDLNDPAPFHMMNVSFPRKETCASLKFNVYPFSCFDFCWPAPLCKEKPALSLTAVV